MSRGRRTRKGAALLAALAAFLLPLLVVLAASHRSAVEGMRSVRRFEARTRARLRARRAALELARDPSRLGPAGTNRWRSRDTGEVVLITRAGIDSRGPLVIVDAQEEDERVRLLARLSAGLPRDVLYDYSSRPYGALLREWERRLPLPAGPGPRLPRTKRGMSPIGPVPAFSSAKPGWR